MAPRLRSIVTILSAAYLWTSLSVTAKAETEVDLALVLAVDVSRSMDPDEQELQRQGFIEAFRSSLVHDAIHNGMLGRIAVTYVEWSGVDDQTVIVPWTVIGDSEGAIKFADGLSQTPIGRIRRTSISGAIDFSVQLLGEMDVEPMRRVIDISGDGPNSSGRGVVKARDEAVARGITINGLPIMLKRPSGFGDMENLDHYYRDCVIGGQGAFLIPVRERHQFAEAIRTKIIREIAGLPPQAQIERVQAEAPVDCLAGERRMYRWNRN
ncbi:DUF1194 domain-containing protein [Microvirga lenta]|uniref:DUF1194 domain-containing protein n=1 Tax=Microvirga lenta TaxID=2881337 RepID=UPI001CFF8851|nr:DUF1194 domain-containing protein [Microvirga lenta]MCB5175148.1 DUF1194 domain-containing protein [Microvirga lenta]